MMSGKKDFYSPLVSGAPRTGFTLLITIARHLIRFAKSRRDNKLKLLRALVETLGEHVHHSIVQAFAEEGIKRDLVFNPMFHPLIGGPKWISQDDSRYACFRKYIGISGKGDFTLIMKHPRAIMDCDTVVHSHVAPSTWLELPEYDGHTRFAAMRNPCGTLNSATFSINAITSEYIQRFLPPEDDNDMLRQYLAKYKLTNLVFFERLVDFYRSYYADFAGCREHFITLKWEDLILQPVKTILQLAHQAGIELPEHGAKAIWSSMAYRSLGHQHNFRKGKVGDWMTSLLNEHLEIIKGSGIEQIMVEMGYGPIRYLNEADYTPFQREMVGYVRRGKVYEDYPDPNLFLFAFQKSNIKWDGLLNFKEYPWRTWTKIERSSFDDDRVVQKVWEAAESAASSVNPVLLDFLEGDYSQPRAAADYLEKLNGKHGALLETMEDGRYKYAIQNLLKIKIEEERTMRVAPITVPKTALQWDPALNLSFVQNEADVFLSNIKVYLKKGARSFLFRPFNEVAADLVKRMLDRGETGEQCRFFALERECRAAAPRRVEILAEQDAEFAADVTVMLEDDPDALSSLLLNSIDMRQGTILAPVTSRFSQKNPLFVVAIPKSGTHLLFELVRALGYTDGLTLTDPPRNGFWYFLEYSNAHTSARDFFIDSVRRAQFGNRRHPFRTSPTLFMYRNPVDIVVSEASYYHREGKTAFGGYLSELSPEERLLRLINDPWLLGTIRDRLGNFIAWMDFPNVIPISFEELIGSKGEGSDEVRDRLIWSVQLKLHVPGNPPVIGAKVFNEASPTFRKGQAGSHRHYFTPRAYSAFEELPQDFMEKLGYEAREEETSLVLPKRVRNFVSARLSSEPSGLRIH